MPNQPATARDPMPQMIATDAGGSQHVGTMQDKPQGLLRVQVNRFTCTCGWEGEWKISLFDAADEFREHMDLIDYAIENG